MNFRQKGNGVLRLLLITSMFAALYFVVTPEYQAPDIDERHAAEQAVVTDVLDVAGSSKLRIAQSFSQTLMLPRNTREADALTPENHLKPELVRKVELQHDRDGNTVVVMVYLNSGLVENILGGEQYVYYAGLKTSQGGSSLKWECGARNIDLNLLPEDCRG